MLSVMAKRSAIFKWECVNTLAFLLLLDNDSAIKEHHLFCNHSSGLDDISILASNNNDFKVTLRESLLINRDLPHF